MKYMIALVAALVLNATANLLMKVGAQSVAQSGGLLAKGLITGVKTVVTNVTLIVGLTCFALNAALYLYALQSKALKISLAYPIMVGGGFVLIALIARFHPALAETLTREQLLGVALVLLGIVLIASGLDSAGAIQG